MHSPVDGGGGLLLRVVLHLLEQLHRRRRHLPRPLTHHLPSSRDGEDGGDGGPEGVQLDTAQTAPLAPRGGRGPGVSVGVSVRVRFDAGVLSGVIGGSVIGGRISGCVGVAFLVVGDGGLRLFRVHFAEDPDGKVQNET